MKRLEVVFLSKAAADLVSLNNWIASEAGEDVARTYLDRLERFADTLGYFPHRGTLRRVNSGEYRSITFERRHIIVYQVKTTTVDVFRILDARRDWIGLLPG